MHTSFPQRYGNGTLKVCRRGKQSNIILAAFSRVKVRNAIDDDTYEDLIALLSSTSRDITVAAVVLTGEGDFFSSGADLKNNSTGKEAGGRRTLEKPAGRFMMEIIRFPKVLVAAVNGPTVGIGVTLLMHCDIVKCSPSATFWAPFTRLALVPELCSSVTFPASMGLSKANELLLLGKRIDAQQAVDYNICSQVLAVDDCTDPFDSRSLASRMCEELDQQLLSLPEGPRTAKYFTQLTKPRAQMEEVCRRELLKLDERFDTGQVANAAKHLRIGKAQKAPRSRL